MKTVRVRGASLSGTNAELVTVEAHYEAIDRHRVEVVVSGLPDPVIRESRGRLLCALRENGLRLTTGRLILNLVPAALRKSGEILDLPLVLAAAGACGHIETTALDDCLFLGEVGIDGTLHAVPGGLAAGLAARRFGLKRVVAPPGTAEEAACVPGLEVRRAAHLAGVFSHIALLHKESVHVHEEPRAGSSVDRSVESGASETQDEHKVRRPKSQGGRTPLTALPVAHAPPEIEAATETGARIDEVRGQASGKWALAVSAAGGHGLLFIGPPGTGKSMLASRINCLLPPPSLRERLEITAVLSAAGRWPGGLARERPFRAPHHTVSFAGLVGGGSPPVPGEVSLAHCGVLFLDELPEFQRDVLECLRQPLESGSVLISRAGRQVQLPGRFLLVAAMNPCPCGYMGHGRIACRCSPAAVTRYRQRISGPLLDRIDLSLELSAPTLEELMPREELDGAVPDDRTPAGRVPQGGARQHGTRQGVDAAPATAAGEPSVSGEHLARLVHRARRMQRERGQKGANARLTANDLERWVPVRKEVRTLLERAVDRHALSARALQSLRRVARTLADLGEVEVPGTSEIGQALALRLPVR